jgi:hypothetical protein
VTAGPAVGVLLGCEKLSSTSVSDGPEGSIGGRLCRIVCALPAICRREIMCVVSAPPGALSVLEGQEGSGLSDPTAWFCWEAAIDCAPSKNTPAAGPAASCWTGSRPAMAIGFASI